MTTSRIIAILSLVATALTVAASALNVIRPSWAIYATGLAAAILAFTERVTGGASAVNVAEARQNEVAGTAK